MIDGSADPGLDSYRARLSQALGTGAYQQDDLGTVPPPRMGPPGQADPRNPDDPYSTPDQGGLPTAGASIDTAPPAQGQGPDTGSGVEVPNDPSDPSVPDAAPMSAGQGSSQGAGPTVAPSSGGSMSNPDYGVSTPTLDQFMPSSLAPTAPEAPTAPRAAQASTAPSAKEAPKAPGAPTIDGAASPPTTGTAANVAIDTAPANGGAKNGTPPPTIQFNQDLLATAKTHGQIFAAATPASQTQYMDWWEKEHGSIDAKYNQLKAEMGARPDPNRDPTRREQFQTLQDFGMQLLARSARGTSQTAAAGEAALAAQANQKARQQATTDTYDSRVGAIEKQREVDQKDLGNYGQAVREDALITDAKTRTSLALAKAMAPPKAGEPMTRLLANNQQVQWNAQPTQANPNAGSWDLSRDAQGKPLPAMLDQGPRGGVRGGGSAVPHFRVDSDGTINVWNPKSNQFDPAVNSATGRPMSAPQKTGDPGKDYENMIGKLYNKNYDNLDEAKQGAQDYIDRVYGPNAIENQRAKRNTVTAPGGSPPASMLTEGKAQKFKDGSTWTLDHGIPKKLN